MKKILILSFLSSLSAFSLLSCSKIKDKLFPAFESELAEVAINIPITIAGMEARASNTVHVNLDSIIKDYTENTFGINNLNSVKVKNIGVFLLNADEMNDVSNFETVRVMFSSNTNNAPVVVATAAIPNMPTTNINIQAKESTELKEYLKGNQLTYTVNGTARRTTTKILNASVLVTLRIK